MFVVISYINTNPANHSLKKNCVLGLFGVMLKNNNNLLSPQDFKWYLDGL